MNEGFGQFKLNKQILNAVADLGFEQPTAIQLKAIPMILAGQDVIGIAQTGTGKTAAYLLPLIKHLGYAQGKEPRALIVIPTRELAIQVFENFKSFSKYTDLRCSMAFGATGAKKQVEEIALGVDVIIATPGRMLDLYQNGHLILKRIEYFVLDEAERLMDISFISQLYRILEVLPRKRKHLLFSATMSDLVKRIANDFIAFPNIINIEPEQKTAATVSQLVYMVPNIKTKINLLEWIINNAEASVSDLVNNAKPKFMVFCKTKETATNIHKYFTRMYGEDYARVVHGNKAQQARINAVKQFSETEIPLLIATDVAARGIDIADVTHVINFDVPLIYEDYIHRIGRTGRAFKSGQSVTFVTAADKYHLKKIETLIRQQIDIKPLPADVETEVT